MVDNSHFLRFAIDSNPSFKNNLFLIFDNNKNFKIFDIINNINKNNINLKFLEYLNSCNEIILI